MKTLEINIPDKLFDFIQQMVDAQKIESIESFVIHATMGLAELYGYNIEGEEGKSLSDFIAELIVSKIGVRDEQLKKVETVVKEYEIPNMGLIMEAFGSSKFMYPDALYTTCVISRMKKGEQPLSKEEFSKTLIEMEKAGILSKIVQGEKVMWKKN
ncbi:MAG: hypothetical protein ACTSQE_00365 [Candidatus Heimdallarchaeaceae archaeon]